ncbi:inositol hexakisphosphate and diphosphoinositol-pentakisphosphate kinase isoform X6 [Zeugodacus cucurbitae]|uniref:inositol hexakisphosphate and diphosphoinositol-pentakisphosphate kinase isoform X6 n=1 Tax=Zeugodacus cucurbitae TaxID=28588 RepID=UPI0023D92FB3|nr:inositol hexakisphosphate and diphosphoinositol-pentakisphosphate kinase isoform X6 [Zeugodacus cucurbitae]
MSNMDWVWWKDWWRVKRLRKRLRHAFDAREQQEAAENAEGTSATKHCRACNKALPDISCMDETGRPCRRCRRRHVAANTAVAGGSGVERTPAAANKPDDYENNGYCFEDHPDEEDEDEACGGHNDVPLGVGFDDVNYYYGEDDDVGYDNVADDDFCYCDECWNGDGESNDGMDSDCSTCSNPGKQVVVGICAMAKKTQSKPMKEILTRLQEFEFIKMLIFSEDVILKEPVENWPLCDCLISFHSKGFPLEKAIQYAQLRKPYVLNNLHMQYDIQDRRRVYAILEKEGIEIPRYAVLDRDSPDPKQHELIESEDHVEVNGIIFNKPFVEKPVSAEDHNIYIYYPTSAGGGSQRLFRKIGSRSSVYSPESRVRKTGSFIYEDFMPTDGTDVKVYTVGPDYAHAEARKSPALDGKVERDSEGKEIRYPVILNNAEKLISRKVCLAFKQTVCGFDLLRANGKSYVCDVNGFSFVKNSNKYYDDCAKILGNMILRELTPTLHIPWLVPFQLDDPPIVPTTFGKMMELRCVVAVIRHGDRTPKQKMKLEVRHPKFFEIFEKYDGYKDGHVKLKRPKQLQEILDIARYLLSEIQNKSADAEIQEKESKLEQLKNVLEMYGHFSGINRKVQMKYQPKGRPRGSSSDDDAPKEPSLVLILKWGGELTPAGRIQAEELGRIFRCMYPGGQGRQDYSGTQGLGLLRLHSTFRHDLKIYASDEGRVQMTAAAFAKGLLALEGELTPILVQMVKSANTNGLLDNDCDSSKYQNLAKQRLHDLMRVDREFSADDREVINPCNSISINQALDFVKNPVECCNHVHKLIKELLTIISVKKEDPKTKDAILYHGETWDLMARRWEKIEKDFSTKSKQYDISKVPDIYDCIKYDLQHNQHTLQYDQAEELYIYAKYLADIVIPQEYGSTVQEKLAIGQGICTPLLKKIKADLQRNIEEVGDESVNRLNPHYSHGVASPGRHVRTRLYFTSESHVHSLLTVLRYGGLLNVLNDEQWRRAMDYISMVSELNYMSQVVIMLYEDPTKDPTSEERFHVELHFSPGVNCCVQKNLPPGPGFRPHSRNDSGHPKQLGSSNSFLKNNSAGDEANPPRIEEENDSEDSPVRSQSDGYDKDSPPHTKHQKSKPIPIGAHHTVSGHEAAHLAKRLNEELASQQHSLESQRPISPDAEPRSRSYEQRDQKRAKDAVASMPQHTSPLTGTNNKHEFKEILNTRSNPNFAASAGGAFHIRVTDSLTFYKIDSSTNELPLSDIDFSLNPLTPESPCNEHKSNATRQKRHMRLLTMRAIASIDEPDAANELYLPKISPCATNERPLSCNCLSGGGAFDDNLPHSHSKSMADISPLNEGEMLHFVLGSSPISASRVASIDDFQLSCSAPATILNSEFRLRRQQEQCTVVDQLRVDLPSNSPTASTLKLCQESDERQLQQQAKSQQKYATELCGGVSADVERVPDMKTVSLSSLPTVQSAPVMIDVENPFKFTQQAQQPFVNKFTTINEFDNTHATNTAFSSTVQSSSACDFDTLTQHKNPDTHADKRATNYHHNSRLRRQQQHQHQNKLFNQPQQQTQQKHALHANAARIPDVIVTLSSSSNDLSNLMPDTNQFNSKLTPTVPTTYDPTNITTTTTIITTNTTTTPNINDNMSASASMSTFTSMSTSKSTPMPSSVVAPNCTSTATSAADGNATPVSSSSSVSSRRQRHSIAGQMSYMKMLGFGGFSKKMATSSSSLFSTAVISGSSSAPNLRDMIPCAVSSSVLEGFGGVPPIRPLETLHNALSLKQLDQFLHKMTTSPLFKTPASSPPKHPSTPQQGLQGALQSMCSLEAATSYLSGDSMCQCQEAEKVREPMLKNAICIHPTVGIALEQGATEAATTEAAATAAATTSERANKYNNADANATTAAQPTVGMWSQQSSVASSTEPSSPAISDTYSHETPSGEMSISITSAEGSVNILPVAEELVKFFPQIEDEDLNAVSVYTPMNTDALDVDVDGVFTFGGGSSRGDVSACLTPVSFGMDISMIANKGSMTLSVDGFDDDEETTLSAATTPSLPVDEPKLETCYCCPTHAEMAEPPDVEDAFDVLHEPLKIPDTKIISSSPEAHIFGEPTSLPPLPLYGENPLRRGARKATDPISPKIKKQISLFEGGEYERQKEYNNLHASINIPSASTLKQDARLRKFETLTQSTSNSNFPFASNTLKRAQHNTSELDDVSHTQSCINLKSSVCGSPAISVTASPLHKAAPMAIVTQPLASATTSPAVTAHGATADADSVGPPRPGALIVKERFIEPPKRIPRSFHSKTQSMDADFLFNEFLLVPARSPTHAPISPEGGSRTSSASTSPASRSNSRFMAAKIVDDMATLQRK